MLSKIQGKKKSLTNSAKPITLQFLIIIYIINLLHITFLINIKSPQVRGSVKERLLILLQIVKLIDIEPLFYLFLNGFKSFIFSPISNLLYLDLYFASLSCTSFICWKFITAQVLSINFHIFGYYWFTHIIILQFY